MVDMLKDFSKKQIKNYLNDTSKCPLCKEYTVKVEEEFVEESMSREIHCENCNINFHEVYELITIELIK